MGKQPFGFVRKRILFGAAIALIGGMAMAQGVGEITVTAPHAVRQSAGSSSGGGRLPVDIVSLSRHVSYADLDLSTAAGVQALKDRVAATAKEACAQLDQLYPPVVNPALTTTTGCVQSTTDNAMAQVDLVMAAAAGK